MDEAVKSERRYAIVTGGAGGLGRAFCQQLAGEGWQLAIVDIDSAGAEETLHIVERSGGSGRIELCDVTDPAAWLALRARLQSDWPRLDLLVNNAGMFASGRVGQLEMEQFERVVRLNLMSVVYGCDAMVPWLADRARRHAAAEPHVINVASVFAFYCPPAMAAYNVSKAGVIALSETLEGELRPQGVGVTVVCPGPMPTRFVERAYFDGSAMKQLTELYLRQSGLTPERVAAAALRAARRRRLYCVMGGRERWYWRAKRLAPRAFLKMVARRMRRDMQSQESRVERREPEGGKRE